MKFRAFWDVAHVVILNLTDVSEMGIASVIALMMEVVRTSKNVGQHQCDYTTLHPRRLKISKNVQHF
jgi:hypothetical protein